MGFRHRRIAHGRSALSLLQILRITECILFDSIGTGSGSNETVVVSFWSDVEPGWADFYTRCDGNGNLAYNLAFTVPDSDPIGPRSNGHNNTHLLGPVPEPASIVLVGLGVAGLAFYRKRMSR